MSTGFCLCRPQTFQITNADGSTVRFRHELYNLVGSLGGNSIGIVARALPGRFRAAANNRIVVACTYRDTYGSASAAGSAGFTTAVPEQPGTATLTFPNANSVRSELTDPNGIVAIQLAEFILPEGGALNDSNPVRLDGNRYRAEVPLGTFGAWTCNWTYSDSLGSGKTATASATRSL